MRKKTLAKILDLASQGLDHEAIAAKTRCKPATISKVLEDCADEVHQHDQIIPARHVPEGTTMDVTGSVKVNRATFVEQIQRLSGFVNRVADTIEDSLEHDPHNAQRLQQLCMSYGIITTKQAELLRFLRDLEAEATDDLDVKWEVRVRAE